jgi:hypothetical protein
MAPLGSGLRMTPMAVVPGTRRSSLVRRNWRRSRLVCVSGTWTTSAKRYQLGKGQEHDLDGMRWSYRLAALHSIATGSALAEDARYITKPMNLKCATGLAFQVATKCETHRGHGGLTTVSAGEMTGW